MRTKNLGLLVLRAGVGGALIAHGMQKLRGREGATQGFGHLGFPKPSTAVTAATACEIGGGSLLALGLATPVGAGAALGAMGVASDVHRPNGFFASGGGFELPLNLGVGAAALALTGPGACSIDHLLGHRLNRTWMGVTAIVAGLAGAAVVARTRHTEPAPAPDVDLVEDAVSVAGRGEVTVTEVAQTPL